MKHTSTTAILTICMSFFSLTSVTISALTLFSMQAYATSAKHKSKSKEGVKDLPSLNSTKDFGIKPFTYDPHIYSMELGSTTLEQAEKVIAQESGKITASNYGETVIDTDTLNSKEEKQATLVNKNIILADFADLPLDHLQKGRMGFLENKLYFLYYEFDRKLDFDKLEQQVVAKYGKPHRIGGFPDRFLEWRFLNVNLMLKDSFAGTDRMIFTHNTLLNAANKSNENLIKEQKSIGQKQQRAF
jgi:hypothetical protein